MASGLEIISLINGSIEIIKLIGEFYGVIKTFQGLPKAFDEVNNQLPLVRDTIARAKDRVPNLDAEAKIAVKEILQQCEENTRGILKVFEELKDTEGKSFKKAYNRVVISIGKRGRVEDLMKDTLASVKNLAENQVFQIADQVDQIQTAINNLAEVDPSIPDDEMEDLFKRAGNQQFGDNNSLFANTGDAYHTTGGTVNTAGSGNFHQTNNSYGKSVEPRPGA